MPARRRLILTLLVLWVVGRTTADPAAQPESSVQNFPAPFFEAEQLQLADGVVAGVFSSLIEQKSLYAARVEDGRAVARVDDVGSASFAVDGNAIVYAPEGQGSVVRLELATGVTRPIWTADAAHVFGPIHAASGVVRFVAESDGGLRSIRLDANTNGQTLSPDQPLPLDPVDAFNSATSTLLVVRGTGYGFWWHESESWHVLQLSQRMRVLALVDDTVIASAADTPNTLFRRDLSEDRDTEWERLFESNGAIQLNTLRAANGRVTFVERSDAAMHVVWLALDARTGRERAVLPPMASWNGRVPIAWSDSNVVWANRRDGRFFLSSAVLSREAPTISRDSNVEAPPTPSADPGRRGLDWLRSQLSGPFTTRGGRTARLIDSYEDSARAGWVYDAAVASIAFVAAGEPALGSDLLAGLEHLQDDAGAWTFSYDPDAAVPRDANRYVGSIAWVVMAANFYEWETRDPRFAPMARRGLTYLEGFRDRDAASPRYGAFSMGPVRPDVVSTENNVDCYAAFLWRGRLDHNEHDQAIAGDIRRFVVEKLWTAPGSEGAGGFFRVGPGVDSLYLDAQTWTTLAFGDEPASMPARALDTAEQRLVVDGARIGGVQQIVGLAESSDTSSGRTVWAEGTEGMVSALLSVGRTDRARRYQEQTPRYQTITGGIPYATDNDRGWPTTASAAATAWFVLNRLSPPRNPFRPDVGSLRVDP
jgi:hypothetical protein